MLAPMPRVYQLSDIYGADPTSPDASAPQTHKTPHQRSASVARNPTHVKHFNSTQQDFTALDGILEVNPSPGPTDWVHHPAWGRRQV